jgi:hypothetical protein
MNKEKTVFLGGTCNGSTWRDLLIPLLKIKYFNPVVENWTPDCMEEEIRQRVYCDFCLYVITPKMVGVYAIAEAVEDSIKIPWKTVFVVLNSDGNTVFTEAQLKSLNQVGKMIEQNGAIYFRDLHSVAEYLNRPEFHLKNPSNNISLSSVLRKFIPQPCNCIHRNVCSRVVDIEAGNPANWCGSFMLSPTEK